MDQQKILEFKNVGKYDIRIQHLMFQSDIHPRLWDAVGSKEIIQPGQIYRLPILGTGKVFLRWQENRSNLENWADSFEVTFDPAGEPYPYIFGGDKWTMALRHKALQETRNG